MRTWVAILMALAIPLAAAAGWMPGLWPLSTNTSLYTNAIANDLLTNVLIRCYSLGDTNWMETQTVRVVSGRTNDVFSRTFSNAVTNVWTRTYID